MWPSQRKCPLSLHRANPWVTNALLRFAQAHLSEMQIYRDLLSLLASHRKLDLDAFPAALLKSGLLVMKIRICTDRNSRAHERRLRIGFISSLRSRSSKVSITIIRVEVFPFSSFIYSRG